MSTVIIGGGGNLKVLVDRANSMTPSLNSMQLAQLEAIWLEAIGKAEAVLATVKSP